MTEHLTSEHPTDDAFVAQALRGAADTIAPGSGIEAIRARTSRGATVRRLRPWAYGIAGAAVAASAVAAVVLPGSEEERTPVAVPTSEVTVYYLAETGTGWGTVLFREHRTLAGDPLDAAVNAAVGSTIDGEPLAPSDPDYLAPYEFEFGLGEGARADAEIVGTGTERVIEVNLTNETQTITHSIDRGEALPEIEAIVRTAQAAAGEDLPVQILFSGDAVSDYYGMDLSKPIQPQPGIGFMSPMILDSPSEGQVVTDGTLPISGEASVPEATVVWRIKPTTGGKAVLSGYTTAESWDFESLSPYADTLDVSSLAPGSYVLTVAGQKMTNEGYPPHSDTRTFVVE